MRKIVLLLLLLNLTLLGWSIFLRQEAASPPQTVVSDATGVLPIFTLEELGATGNGANVLRLEASTQIEHGRLLGGYDSKEQARVLLQRLLSLDINAVLVERSERLSVDYLVYMPAGESRRLALRKVDELASKGVDANIVDRTDQAGFVVVLGSFTSEHSAYTRVEELRRLGYAAEVRELERVRQTYWAQLHPDSMRLLDERVLEVLRRDFSGIKQL